MASAGAILLPLLKPGNQTLTAIKMENGQLHIIETADSKAFTEALAAVETEPKAAAPKKKKKAASVKRATPCCPTCVPGAVPRASEVLLSFLSDEQHAQWAAHRHIDVVGHLSGHRYRIAHRGSDEAAQWGKICVDLTDGQILHFHDWSVPPEEEVLGAKLVLEHREPWLRNEATCLFPLANGDYVCGEMARPHFTDIFKNPFGGMMDGTESAAMMHQVGSFLLGMTGRDAP